MGIRSFLRRVFPPTEQILDEARLTQERLIIEQNRDLTGMMITQCDLLSDRFSDRFDNQVHLISRMTQRLEELEIQVRLAPEIAAVNNAAFAEYKNVNAGRSVVVVGAGPSLKYYEPIADAVHIGVNSVYKNEKLRLQYYFAQDLKKQDLEFIRDLAQVKCKVFLGLEASTPNGLMLSSESLVARLGATRYFFDPSPSKYLYSDIRFHALMDFYTVVFPALQFALFTNPVKLYLVGCDTSYFGYFDDRRQEETDDRRIFLTQRLRGYQRLKEYAARFFPDTEMISVNPVNLKGLFSDVYTDEFKISADNVQSEPLYGDWEVTDEMIERFVDNHLRQAEGAQANGG